MSYSVSIRRQALKELAKLPPADTRKVTDAIDMLSEEPRPVGCKKLKGRSEAMWRVRVGDYRVIYSIDDEIEVVEVGKIGHRKDVY